MSSSRATVPPLPSPFLEEISFQSHPNSFTIYFTIYVLLYVFLYILLYILPYMFFFILSYIHIFLYILLYILPYQSLKSMNQPRQYIDCMYGLYL